MKKILAILLSTFALLAQARETVTIVYAWSASDVAANFSRTLAEEANKIFDILMGSEVPPRKSFIQSNAKLAKIDI